MTSQTNNHNAAPANHNQQSAADIPKSALLDRVVTILPPEYITGFGDQLKQLSESYLGFENANVETSKRLPAEFIAKRQERALELMIDFGGAINGDPSRKMPGIRRYMWTEVEQKAKDAEAANFDAEFDPRTKPQRVAILAERLDAQLGEVIEEYKKPAQESANKVIIKGAYDVEQDPGYQAEAQRILEGAHNALWTIVPGDTSGAPTLQTLLDKLARLQVGKPGSKGAVALNRNGMTEQKKGEVLAVLAEMEGVIKYRTDVLAQVKDAAMSEILRRAVGSGLDEAGIKSELDKNLKLFDQVVRSKYFAPQHMNKIVNEAVGNLYTAHPHLVQKAAKPAPGPQPQERNYIVEFTPKLMNLVAQGDRQALVAHIGEYRASGGSDKDLEAAFATAVSFPDEATRFAMIKSLLTPKKTK